jgi:hypothetical protein
LPQRLFLFGMSIWIGEEFMRVTSRARAFRGPVLVVLLTTLVATSVMACTRSISGQPVVSGQSPARSTIPGDTSGVPSQGEPGGQESEPSTGAKAPFDPCTIVDWQDFPAVVRPDPVEEWHDPRTVPPNDVTESACMFLNSELSEREQDEEVSKVFHATVGWGSISSMSLDAESSRPGRKAFTIDGQRGVALETVSEDSHPTCVTAVELKEAKGVAVVMVTNSRFTSRDALPCEISLHLLEVVLNRVDQGR